MLKLKGIANTEKVKNESDFYVKIKIGLEGWHATRLPLCYWSIRGEKYKSLIEIRLIKSSGAICAFTVISMPQIHNQETTETNNHTTTKTGLPLFDIASCQKGYYQEAKDFEIYAEKAGTTILFIPNDINLNIVNEPLIFGFDTNNILCSIKIIGMKLNKEGFLEKIK